LHAARDFLYAVLFAGLPWLAWHGTFVHLLGVVLGAEIVLTMADFIVEKEARRTLGDVFPGERVTHAVMAIIYGSMLANLLPILLRWQEQPTELAYVPAEVPESLRWLLTAMAVGVSMSGLRDLYASWNLPFGSWPWPHHISESDEIGDR
jgi:hypothetical protein